MVINQLALFQQQLQHHKICCPSMNRENNNSQQIPQDHSLHGSQIRIYHVDWNNVCKEQALCFPSTQPFYSCYQPFISNVPFLQQPFRYSQFDPRLTVPGFQFFPMTYPFQATATDLPGDSYKTFANTQAPNDEQAKRQVKKTKIQEADSEYLNPKQESQNKQSFGKKNQINARRQPYLHLSIEAEVLGNIEVTSQITRKDRVNRYKIKKAKRIYEKRIVYQCRKSVADNRQRSKGRFVKRVGMAGEKSGDDKFLKKQQSISG